MSSVVILPVTDEAGAITFRAISKTGQSEGATAGQALDALCHQQPQEAGGTLVVLQPLQADEFFSEAQRARLGELMSRWRSARDAGVVLPVDQFAELEALTAAEFEAATKRTERMLKDAST